MFTSWEWKETPLFDIWSSHPEPASPSPPQRGCFPWHHTPHLAPLHWGVATVCQSLGLFMPHPEHLKPSYIQCNVFNILMSYLQLRLKLKKKRGKGHIHVRISVCRTVNKLSIHHETFFCEDETSQSPICPVLDLGLHRSYLGFKWFFFNGFWVNPIRAAQTLCSHPLNSSVVAGEGGTPSGQTPSALRNRECLMCINNNELLGWAAWKNSKQTEVV